MVPEVRERLQLGLLEGAVVIHAVHRLPILEHLVRVRPFHVLEHRLCRRVPGRVLHIEVQCEDVRPQLGVTFQFSV